MAEDASRKSDQAFRTIGELAGELGVPQHILRYWETRFPQLRPLQRAGNRRYYRPADVELARRIHRLLNEQGYTIRGVQQLLATRGGGGEESAAAPAPAAAPRQTVGVDDLKALRRTLAEALEASL
jgi:DNA-binding transcriptional MerR regulator